MVARFYAPFVFGRRDGARLQRERPTSHNELFSTPRLRILEPCGPLQPSHMGTIRKASLLRAARYVDSLFLHLPSARRFGEAGVRRAEHGT